MEPWQAIGKHQLRIEQDVVFVRAYGEVTKEEILALYEHLLAVEKKYGWVFEIVDARQGGSMSAEVRRENAEWHRRHNLEVDAVIFGSSLIVRTMYTLIVHALRLISKSPARIHFVETEADAWAFVEALRQKNRGTRVG
jgi:hypothetical protein